MPEIRCVPDENASSKVYTVTAPILVPEIALYSGVLYFHSTSFSSGQESRSFSVYSWCLDFFVSLCTRSDKIICYRVSMKYIASYAACAICEDAGPASNPVPGRRYILSMYRISGATCPSHSCHCQSFTSWASILHVWIQEYSVNTGPFGWFGKHHVFFDSFVQVARVIVLQLCVGIQKASLDEVC